MRKGSYTQWYNVYCIHMYVGEYNNMCIDTIIIHVHVIHYSWVYLSFCMVEGDVHTALAPA